MDKQLWVLCPICNNKTRTKVREDTELIKFPLFCPKCKTETLINMRRQMADSLEDKPFPACRRTCSAAAGLSLAVRRTT